MRVESYGSILRPQEVRDERLKLATDLLALVVRDVAVLPAMQQAHVREAVKRLQQVQAWCAAHRHTGGDVA
jgi:hypothetical protein